MKETIIEYLSHILKKEYWLELENISLTVPPKSEMWDLSFWCFVLAKDLKKSPNQIAIDLKNIIDSNRYPAPEIERVEEVSGYLNIFLSPSIFADSLHSFASIDLYQDIVAQRDETIYIDYIGANVWKPLHIGHMCTPLQWQVLINAFNKLWYNVISDSHIGDWGIIFGKLIVWYAVYWSEKELEENAVEHLFQIYVKISADAEKNAELDSEFRDAFKKLSQWDSEMKDIWASFTKRSIQAMNILLSRLKVYPLYNIWESFYEWLWLAKMEDYPDLKYPMHQIVEELIDKKIATKNDDGSVWVVFSEESKLPSCILQKRDGTHGYLASDLASIKYRMDNWNPKKILYFVDVRQKLHFEQAFEIARLASWLNADTEITHAHNWFISLKDGAMSTRKWKIIKLEALLDEWNSRAANIISNKRSDITNDRLEKLSEIISIGAIKYGYLKKSRQSDSIFDWDEYMNFEWNSGPYIQYAYVRAQKILGNVSNDIDTQKLIFKNIEEKNLISHIINFPNIIHELTRTYYPHILCQYVYDLTKLFSSLYANVQILSEADDTLRNSRVILLQQFSRVLEECFDILWISLPKEM